MGRRGNRNNKNKGKTGNALARKKFKRNVCSKCRLCDAATHMRLCYNRLYVRDPETFMGVVLPTLIERRADIEELKKVNVSPNADNLQTFKEVFCDAGLCAHCKGATHKALEICFMSFVAQTKKPVSGQEKRQKPPEPHPVMTVLISDNDAFEQELMRILNEYNNKERGATGQRIEDHNKQHDQVNASGHYTEGIIDS